MNSILIVMKCPENVEAAKRWIEEIQPYVKMAKDSNVEMLSPGTWLIRNELQLPFLAEALQGRDFKLFIIEEAAQLRPT
jgi:hypothetical protein